MWIRRQFAPHDLKDSEEQMKKKQDYCDFFCNENEASEIQE